MERHYTEIGKKEGYTQDSIDMAVLALKQWQDIADNKSLLMSQGMAINKAIEMCLIPEVSAVAVDGHIDDDSFCGIKAVYSNGKATIYIADRGTDCTIVATDFEMFETIREVKENGNEKNRRKEW